jgi:hypothetical protein
MTGRETAEPTTASIVVDRVLENAVTEVLECKKTHR